ncbi:MAG TPA: DUF58 domain-containing protein [Tepidisphaeraceae bacterium]|nr:DUF58 domain-containing protein [Tepidisphaeraceae bacterium]
MSTGIAARLRDFLSLEPKAPPGSTPVRRSPGFDFSLTGVIYCFMMGFMGLAAIQGQANLLFGVFGVMIGILLVSGVICRTVIRRLTVTRILPDSAIVGRTATILYQFQNKKRYWPSLSVRLAELDGVEAFTTQPAAYLLHAAAKMTATVPTEIVPKRRGICRLNEYQISTSFPFGFIRRARVNDAADMMVIYPAVGRVSPRLLTMCRSAEKVGASLKPQSGGQDEFYGVKQYRPGESQRSIYWRRSAKSPGFLVSKEMTQVAPPRLMLLVDTHIGEGAAGDLAAVERAIAMAGTLASHALERDMAVGICAWTGAHLKNEEAEFSRAAEPFDVLDVQRGKRQRRDVLSMLAHLPRNKTADAESLIQFSRPLIQRGVTGILFTRRNLRLGLADEARGSLLIICADSRVADQWFSFDSTVDFAHCMPLDQLEAQSD